MAAEPDPDRLLVALEARRHDLEQAARSLAERLRGLLDADGVEATVQHRVKSADSYARKLERCGGDGAKRPIGDWLGLRVVCPFLSDTERVERLLREAFTVVEVEHKGAERGIQSFGYDSIHLLVRIPDELAVTAPPGGRKVAEIQVRTILQDAWAQIEHRLVYKSDSRIPRLAMQRRLAALAATLTLADVTFAELREQHDTLARQDAARRVPRPLTASGEDLARIARPDPVLRDPDARHLESLILEALTVHGRGDLELAIRLYGRILRQRLPSDEVRSVIYNHRGVALLDLGRPREAARDFAAAIRRNPANHRAHFNAGLVHRARGRRARAIRCFQRALEGPETRDDAVRALTELDALRES